MKKNKNKYLYSLINKIKYILFISVLLILVSCSQQKRYEYLSYIFDGVPQPDSTVIISDTNNLATKTTSTTNSEPVKVKADTVYNHPPAEDNGCNNCHEIDKSYALIEKQPTLCFNCHDDFSKKFKELHGPVMVGNCTACHDPHKSEYKPLIKLPGQELCYYCHQKEAVLKNDIHSGIGDTKCWDCHSPHGGSERTFMK